MWTLASTEIPIWHRTTYSLALFHFPGQLTPCMVPCMSYSLVEVAPKRNYQICIYVYVLYFAWTGTSVCFWYIYLTCIVNIPCKHHFCTEFYIVFDDYFQIGNVLVVSILEIQWYHLSRNPTYFFDYLAWIHAINEIYVLFLWKLLASHAQTHACLCNAWLSR